MRFLANINETNNHCVVLSEKLKQSDEAYFAVAFLKMSGLTILSKPLIGFLKSGGKLTVVVGQNFALTEPKALLEFRNMFRSYPKSKIYLAKANSKDSVFHPKLYLFKSKKSCSIISGSANMTKGGLQKNKESSINIDCKTKDDTWIDAIGYFNYLINPSNADEADLLVIKQYESFFDQQKQHNKKTKSIPTRTKSRIEFDYANLVKHFKKFNTPERQKNFKEKQNNYREARKVLNQIADNTRLTQKQFEPLLDLLVGRKEAYSLWDSGSLFRLRRKVYPHFREFRKLLIYIRDNKNQNADIVFDRAKEMVKNVNGAAVNYVTEIMMTYNSVDFANINRNPITVLKEEGGVKIKAHSSSYKGVDYSEYCDLVKEISLKLELKNMLEADTFFNEIYWKIKY